MRELHCKDQSCWARLPELWRYVSSPYSPCFLLLTLFSFPFLLFPFLLSQVQKISDQRYSDAVKAHSTEIHCFQPSFSDVISIMKMECSYSRSREEESIGVNAGYGSTVFGVRSDNFEESEEYKAYLVGGTLITVKTVCIVCGKVAGEDKPIASDFALNTGVTLTRLDVPQQ